MENEILNYFGNSHAQYIHARGEFGTKVLIKVLNCQPKEEILEIGFGTGATLAQLFSSNKNTKFFGLELSELMYKKAKARFRFCLIGESVKLSLMNHKDQIPFRANSFDKIFLESVLAIQEDNDSKDLLLEIQRVLRPNGILIMNETIWLDSTNLHEIHQINELCKRSFGIIQSNSRYPYLKDWKEILADLNFECESVIKLDDVKDDFKSEFRFPYQMLSIAFTAIGKIRSALKRSMRKEKKIYLQKMKQILPANKPLMEGIIIKANNKK